MKRAIAVALFVFAFVVARADVPADDVALAYSGVLEEDGAPVDGTRDIALTLSDGAASICGTGVATTNVVAGRFRVPLPAECAAAVRAAPAVFVEIVVDGATVGSARIGAVPFALQAGAAAAATADSALAGSLVPSGAVMPFQLASCPAGWSELVAARGRAIVGTNPDASNGLTPRALDAAFGAETHTLTVNEMPAHAHNGQTEVVSGGIAPRALDYIGTGGATGFAYGGVGTPQNLFSNHRHGIAAQGGGQPHNNVPPSLALLFCRKD